MSVSKKMEVLLLRYNKFKGFLFTTKGSSKQHLLLSSFTCAFYGIYADTIFRTQILINKPKIKKKKKKVSTEENYPRVRENQVLNIRWILDIRGEKYPTFYL